MHIHGKRPIDKVFDLWRAADGDLYFEFILVCFWFSLLKKISSKIMFIFIYRGLDGHRFLHSGGQSESDGGMSWTRAVRAWGSESRRFTLANHNTQTTINYIINLNDKPE